MDYTVEIRGTNNAVVDTIRILKASNTNDARMKARQFLDRNPFLKHLTTGRIFPSTGR